LRAQYCALVAAQAHGDFVSDFALHREDVFVRPIVAFRPDVTPRRSANELRRDANAIANRLQAAFQHISYAQFFADLPNVDRLALVDFGRVPRDD
jgi:hypothetical protein